MVDLATLRESVGLTREQLAATLDIDRSSVLRWEAGEAPVPTAVPLALLWIRHTRASMQGSQYPLMADIQRLMLDENIDQATAIRSFGVEP